jgi:hypothetical protein
MSKSKFGEHIPQIKEVESSAKVERCGLQQTFAHPRRVQLPGSDGRSESESHPQRWESSAKAYVPRSAQALDADGIDAEVLFLTIPARFINTSAELKRLRAIVQRLLGELTRAIRAFLPRHDSIVWYRNIVRN